MTGAHFSHTSRSGIAMYEHGPGAAAADRGHTGTGPVGIAGRCPEPSDRPIADVVRAMTICED